MLQTLSESYGVLAVFHSISYIGFAALLIWIGAGIREERILMEKEIERLNKLLDPILNSKETKKKDNVIELMSRFQFVEDETSGQWVRSKREDNE